MMEFDLEFIIQFVVIVGFFIRNEHRITKIETRCILQHGDGKGKK